MLRAYPWGAAFFDLSALLTNGATTHAELAISRPFASQKFAPAAISDMARFFIGSRGTGPKIGKGVFALRRSVWPRVRERIWRARPCLDRLPFRHRA
jgi:hypothetical protein